jgi:hypothetical protein
MAAARRSLACRMAATPTGDGCAPGVACLSCIHTSWFPTDTATCAVASTPEDERLAITPSRRAVACTALLSAAVLWATLSGTAPGREAAYVASASATAQARTEGVGTGVPLPVVQLHLSEQGLVLSGTVPSALERDHLLDWARRWHGPEGLVDRLELGPVANPNWLSTAFLPDLRGTRRATATLSESGLTIECDSPTTAVPAGVTTAARAARAAGLRVLLLVEQRTDPS